jgi:hypothetical protein
MEFSPLQEAARCAANEEFPQIFCNPKVHYLVNKSHPLVSIPSQINQVHTLILSTYMFICFLDL